MVEQPINEGQIIKDGAIDSIISDFGKVKKVLEKLDEGLKAVAESSGKITFPTGSKDFEKVLKQMVELEKAYKTQHQTQTDLIKLEQEKEKLRRQKEMADASELRTQKIREAGAKKELTSYQLASRELTQLKNRYKDLAYQKSQGIKFTKDEQKEYDSLGKSISKADKNLKNIDRSVGENFRNVGNYKNAIGGLKSALGQLGLAFGGIAIAKSAFNTIKEFDELNADMAKTLNITTEEASKLSLEFSKMGSVTSISGLQEIAVVGGQLGVASEDIGGFVRSMDKLNIALGSDFGGVEQTATQLGALRNIFTDIKSTDIEKDLLGIGNALNELSSKGAKTEIVTDFANRISGLAIPLGVTSGEILGLSATLAKLNVNAERGGTAVGTIFQKMTQDAEGFAKVAGVSTEEFTELLNTDMVGAFKLVSKAFKGMDGDNVKLSTTLKDLGLSGSGASEVFLKMASNTELLDANIKLSNESLLTQDSILSEVEKKSSTVGASVAKLGNAWDGFILGVNNGTGAQNGIITAFDFIAKNLPTIISLLVKLGAVYLIMIARQKIVNSGVIDWIKNLKNAKVGLDGVTSGAKAFGTALKGAMSAVAIGVFIELAMALYDIASGAANARDAMARLDRQIANSGNAAGAKVEALKETQKQQIASLNELLKAGKISQKDYNKLVDEAKKKTDASLKSNIKLADERKNTYKEQLAEAERLKKVLEGGFKTGTIDEYNSSLNAISESLGITGAKYLNFFEQNASVNEVINQLKANISGTNERLKTYYGTLKEADDETKDFTIKTNESATAITGKGKSTKKTTEEINDYTKALRDLNAEMLMGADDETTDYLRAQEKLSNELEDAKLEVTKKYGILAKEYLIALDKKYIIDEKKLYDDYQDARLARIRQDAVDELNVRASAMEFNTAFGETEKRLAELTRYNAVKAKAKTDEELEKLAKEHEAIMLEIQIKGVEDRINAARAIQQSTGETLGIDSKEYKEAQNRINELSEQYQQLIGQRVVDKVDGLKGVFKKVGDYVKGLFDTLKNQLDSVFDRMIESQNRLIANSQRTIDALKASAIAGNTQAKESILAEEKAIEESQKRIEKAQKRKQRMELISSGINSFNSKVAGGKSGLQALGETGAEMAGLLALLNALPSFFVGTNALDFSGNGIDGKGGRPIIAHPKERIVPADENKKIGFNTTNKQLANIADYYNRGLLVHANQNAPVVLTQDNSEILKGIENGFSKINNWNVTAEQLFGTISVMIEQSKNGDVHRSTKTWKK